MAPDSKPICVASSVTVSSRNASRKLDGRIMRELQNMLEKGAVNDDRLRTLMLDSIRRVHGLRDFVQHLNQMTEGVYVQSLAASKG